MVSFANGIGVAGIRKSAMGFVLLALMGLLCSRAAVIAARPHLGSIDIGHGITLHYIEQGSGPPVVFVHGSIGDYSYWRDQVAAFSDKYSL